MGVSSIIKKQFSIIAKALVSAFLLSGLGVSTSLAGYYSPKSPDELCEIHQKPNLKERLLSSSESQAKPTNQGGFLGVGVCWWHSRLTRNAAYLAYFDPKKEKPNPIEAHILIEKLIANKEVVEIPGYSDFQSFTGDFEKLVVDRLTAWQVGETLTVLGAAFIERLGHSAELAPIEMKRRMILLDDMVNKQNISPIIIYNTAGLAAHSGIIVKMSKIIPEAKLKKEPFYRVTMKDSNSSYTYSLDVPETAPNWVTDNYETPFTPVPAFEKEYVELQQVASKYCSERKEYLDQMAKLRQITENSKLISAGRSTPAKGRVTH